MPYKWVVNVFLHCEILVKMNKTGEPRKNTLKIEERHSDSTATTKKEGDNEGLLTHTELFSASNIEAGAASYSTTWCIVSVKFANNFANPFSAFMNCLHCILKTSWEKIIYKTKMKYSSCCKIFQLASKPHVGLHKSFQVFKTDTFGTVLYHTITE